MLYTAAIPSRGSWLDLSWIRNWLGWPYLAVVGERHPRGIVGASTKPKRAEQLAAHALVVAVRRRHPSRTVLVLSGQGSPYGGDDWLLFPRANKLEPRMGRRGNCRDNAVADSFVSSLKKQRIE